MIKARATAKDGTPIIIFGLSQGNIDGLKKGEPIFIELADMGFTHKVIVMFGETESEIAEALGMKERAQS